VENWFLHIHHQANIVQAKIILRSIPENFQLAIVLRPSHYFQNIKLSMVHLALRLGKEKNSAT
jgi:hypothetical protein